MCSDCYGCVRLGKTLQFRCHGSSPDICSYFRWERERCEDSAFGAHVNHFHFGRFYSVDNTGPADEIDTIGISLDYKFAFNAAVHRID